MHKNIEKLQKRQKFVVNWEAKWVEEAGWGKSGPKVAKGNFCQAILEVIFATLGNLLGSLFWRLFECVPFSYLLCILGRKRDLKAQRAPKYIQNGVKVETF